MQNILSTNSTVQSKPFWQLLMLLLLFILGGLILFSLLAPLIVLVFYNIGLTELSSIVANPRSYEDSRQALLVFQLVSSVGLFIITPIVFILWILKEDLKSYFQLPKDWIRPGLMVVIILFCFMVVNSLVIEWNQKISFPESLTWFEEWAQAKESQLEELTDYLTTFDGIGDFLLGVVVIALVPAIGEELLFRGLLQNLFHKGSKNPHLAIWISAIIFGVFHLQFYGVLPRIFLGALFGYIYYWSGHLSLAMLGHFMNNALTLTMIFLSQKAIIDFDPKDMDSSPSLFVIFIFFIAGSVLLYLFRILFLEHQDG